MKVIGIGRISIKLVKEINDYLCSKKYHEYEWEIRIKYINILTELEKSVFGNDDFGPFHIKVLEKAPKSLIASLYRDQLEFIQKYKIII